MVTFQCSSQKKLGNKGKEYVVGTKVIAYLKSLLWPSIIGDNGRAMRDLENQIVSLVLLDKIRFLFSALFREICYYLLSYLLIASYHMDSEIFLDDIN